ncbi:MAG TPA: hypothetical protein VK805_21360 [Candidatus Baltobacteraceae bacterium]|nr:hypothetical protein [Candidatus Baltobacteraceae bacterium]
MKCAPLNGAHGQAKTPSGLRAGQALHLAVQNDDPQVLSKPSNCLKQGRASFAFAEDFFWCRSAIGNLHATLTLRNVHPLFVKRLSRAALAQQHQRFVDDYPGEPGRKSGVFAESLQIHEYPLKGALHRIFRVLLIAKDAEGRAIGFALMTFVEFSEGVVVSGLSPRDE